MKKDKETLNSIKQFHKYYEPNESEIQKAKELYCAARAIPMSEIDNALDDVFYWTIKNIREGLI